MVSVVIFAGGTGTRMKSSDIPKQFIEVCEKPIIIRTLEQFSKHPKVDRIVISCIAEWIDFLKEEIQRFNVKKIVEIVPGGMNGHQSIHNGLLKVEEFSTSKDIVLICDGVRPVISEVLITNCINNAEEFGTAVPVTPSIDSVLESMDGKICSKSLPRGNMYITQAPQGYTVEKIIWAHKEAEKRNIESPTSSCELLIELGEEVHIFKGERENIKVTTPEDLYVLRSHYYYERYKSFVNEEMKYGL